MSMFFKYMPDGSFAKVERMHDMEPGDVCYRTDDEGNIIPNGADGTIYYVYMESMGCDDYGKQVGKFYPLVEVWRVIFRIKNRFTTEEPKQLYGIEPRDLIEYVEKLGTAIKQYEFTEDDLKKLHDLAVDEDHIKEAIEWWSHIRVLYKDDVERLGAHLVELLNSKGN